ncbi:cupin domain-containing protein [Streptomyces sp. AV19]|uniref:cupin domain-containing protein n=1 Tax=Streptomyces sp. AV19 TaxID=2793068 RepID=UPI0018FEEABD|nr:cupin domain-containing protein [Streptomyces sp. AV19]MBH1933896.1 cupin domain-containing protein [Streptomyces sp. AV19]MDG4535616.1 cupin domain-containing protein [Streptomyces sp. AV19]
MRAAPAEWVTGAVSVERLAAPVAPSRLRVDSVRFAPGARTVWHRHPLGQVLHITAGSGLVGRAGGGPAETVRTGDTVVIGADEWHWHGAGPEGPMEHLAVQEAGADGTEAERGAPVSDAEYASVLNVGTE